MKKTPFILLVNFILILSCSKNEGEDPRTSPGHLFIHRTGDIKYNISLDQTFRSEEQSFKVLTAAPADPDARPVAIHFWFTSWPTSSSTFMPVEFLGDRHLADSEVGITIDFPAKDTLYSTGLKYAGYAPDPADPIEVIVRDGKLAVMIPSMSGHSEYALGIDSATFEGSFVEN